MIIKFLTKPIVAITLSVLIFVVSAFVAKKTFDSGWVASAGAMITLLGILMTTRSLLRHESIEDASRSKHFSIENVPMFNDKEGMRKQEEEKAEKLKDTISESYGFWFLVVGTFIWAYGDRLFGYLL